MNWRKTAIVAGFGLLGATGVHRIVAPMTRGRGVILTLHHVRPARAEAFAPNDILAITPEFLARVIARLMELGYRIVTMDEAVRLLRDGVPSRERIAVLTFDDGFRDNLEHALPVLERFGVPGTFYVTTGYAERTARLWWVELEEVIRRAHRLDVVIGDERIVLDARDASEKSAAYEIIYWRLRRGPESRLLAVIADLCERHGVVSSRLVDELCLDWDDIVAMSRHPLVTIGAHTLSHPMLAKHDVDAVRRELNEAKGKLELQLGLPVRHLAYPVGDPTSAGAREFQMAGEAGYHSAVTTRPGLLFPAHKDRLMALPRVSVNGRYQTVRDLDILLSGFALTLWNKGRRVVPLEA